MQDEESFVILFPVRVFVRDAVTNANGSITRQGTLLTEINDSLCVPVFTDEDLFNRFGQANRLGVVQGLILPNKALLIDFLNGTAVQNGAVNVAFDINERGRARFMFTIQETIECLRSQIRPPSEQ